MSDSAPSKEGLIFPLVPKPCPEESVSSWVIRLCGAYQCTFSRLQILSGVSVHDSDWDCGLAQEVLDALLRACSYSYADFGYRRINPIFLNEIGFKLTPRYFQDKPAYAWCPTCFDEDPEPYLRWQWRFRNFTHCVKHRTLLLDSCLACGAKYLTHRSLLVAHSMSLNITNLGCCQGCCTPLGSKLRKHFTSLFGRETSFRHTWPDAANGEEIDFDFQVQRIPEPACSPIFALFRLSKDLPNRDVGSDWSKPLTLQSRQILARALMSIRREMRREKVQRLSKVLS
jgi:hypothetical protein